MAAVATLWLGFFQVLSLHKFWAVFATWDDRSWLVIMRNFHLSGYDPQTLSALTDGSFFYDPLRHPLLQLFLLPLYLLNQLLWMLTGMNCAMLIISILWLLMGIMAAVLLWRILRVISTPRPLAALLTAFYFSMAHVLLPTISADHFGISLFLIIAFLYRFLTSRPGNVEQVAWTLLLGGVTLTNAALIALAVMTRSLSVDGFNITLLVRRLLPSVITTLLLAVVGIGIGYLLRNDLSRVDSWANAGTVPLLPNLVENFFGESLQLHRDHLLDDALVRRPVIVAYRWWWQYVVEGIIVALFCLGAWRGRHNVAVRITLSWLLFSVVVHLVAGFGVNEVYIMTAHWAVVLPVTLAALHPASSRSHDESNPTARPIVSPPTEGNPMCCSAVSRSHDESNPAYPHAVSQSHTEPLPYYHLLLAILGLITLYLLVYHTYLLWHYLTWPVNFRA